MLSRVLRGSRAVQVNVAIMRTFVRLREMLSWHEELLRKIDAMEKRYDADFKPFSKPFGGCWNANSGKENDWISRQNRVPGKVRRIWPT